jgi:ribosomal protein S18 acetylase RimI-like enzyme
LGQVTIDIAGATDEVLEAAQHLLRELSPSAPALSSDDLHTITRSESTRLLVARDDGRIVGMLTLAVFRIPSGVRAWIEDVSVAPESRGKGIGEALTREALAVASSLGARTVELTSRSSRDAANRLYLRLGFQRRDTNLFRYSLIGPT